ncbi:MAG: choice-of-anchor D domain-containing protein [Muribaculaceae bacterium]|nr:choice-of-anchor D domain-containing protein [Muribaculaceae bacterium]
MRQTIFLRLCLLFCVLTSFIGARAETLTVYDGTTTNGFVPIYGYYADAYLKCEYVIPADDLADMANGTISGLKWYLNTASADWGDANFQVFVKEIEGTTLSSYQGTDGATDVYEGALSVSSNELNVTFTTPYEYGGGNLLIGVYNTVKGGYATVSFYGQTVSGASVQGHNTSSLSSVPVNQRNFIPKTTFTYTPGEKPEYGAKVSTESLAFGSQGVNTSNTLNVTVKNNGLQSITPTVSGLAAPFSTTYSSAALASGETATIPVTFHPTEVGDFTGAMTIDCGGAGTFNVSLSGAGEMAITLCDGTTGSLATNEGVPVYGYYYDSQGKTNRFVYPSFKLASLVGKQITGVTFYATNDITLSGGDLSFYAGIVENEGATSATVTGLTEVWRGALTPEGKELTFEFNTPVIYSGGHLAFGTYVNTGGSYQTLYWYGESTDHASACYQGRNEVTAQFLPKVKITYVEPTGTAMTVDLEALEFGTLIVNGTKTLNVKVTNTGATAVTPTVSGLTAPFSTTYTPAELASGQSVNIPVTFNPSAVGNYTGTLTIDGGFGDEGVFSVSLAGVCDRLITICDGTSTNYNLPVYGGRYNQTGANTLFVYPAEKLAGLTGQDIVQLKFFAQAIMHSGGKLKVKLAEVESTTVSSLTQYSDDVFTTVVEGYVENQNENNEIVWAFDVPFHYNGGNLAIATEVTEAGTSSYSSRYYGETQTYTSGYAYSAQQFLPKVEIRYQEPAAYGAALTPTSYDFGTVLVGDSKETNITLRNTGSNAFTAAVTALNAPFSTTATGGEVAANEALTIPVTFAPTAGGNFTATLTVNCGEAGEQTVELTGKGLETPTGYQENFNGITIDAKIPSGWKSVRTSTVTPSIAPTYQYAYDDAFSVMNVDGNKAIAFDRSSYNNYYYWLISPAVKGNVFIMGRYTQSSTYDSFKVYPVGEDGTIQSDEIAVEWDPALTTDGTWSYGTFNLAETSKVAILMRYGAMDFFAADEVSAEKEIAMVSATNGAETVVADGTTAHFTINAKVKNQGLSAVDAADYQLTVADYDNPTVVIATFDGQDIAVGAEVEQALEFDYTIPNIQPSQIIRFTVKETMKNTVANTSYVTVTAAVPKPTLFMENGTTAYTKQDMGVFKGSRDLKFKVGNKNGTADLTYTVVPVDGVTVDAASGTVAVGEVSDVITLIVTAPAEIDGVIANITTNGAALAVEARAAALAETTFLEDFEDDLDNGWIVDEGVTFPSRPNATDYNQKAAYVYAASASANPASLISPAIEFTQETGLDVHFTTYRQLYAGSVQAYYSTDRATWTSLGDVATESSKYVNHTFALPEAGTYYFKFTMLGCYLDDIYGGERAVIEHDAFFESFTGPTEGMVNKESTFTGTLRNLIDAEDYDIVLTVDGEDVATVTKTVDGSADFVLTYMPHAAGTIAVQAEARIGDYVVASQVINVTVAEESAVSGVIVNEGTSLTEAISRNESVISSYYEHTFTRMLYTAEQLAAAGVKQGDKITKIAFLLKSNARTKDLDFNVWARNTEATAVSGPTIYSSDEGFNKVYENSSVISLIPAAGGEMLLELSSPIIYSGNSLEFVTATYGEWQTNYIQFYYNSVAGQMLRFASDGEVDDYETTMASVTGVASSQLPSLKLYIESELAVVSGTVTDGTNPVEGAKVEFTQDGKLYEGMTNADGQYSVNIIQAGEGYTMTVTAEGYDTYTETLDITEDMTKDVVLSASAFVVTLAEALNGAVGVEYLISDELIVAVVETDGTAILTDNQGNWVGTTFTAEMRDALNGVNSVKNVRGTLTDLDINPVITLTATPVAGESSEEAVLETINLSTATFIDVPGNCLAEVTGYYKDGHLQAFSGTTGTCDPGQILMIDNKYIGDDLNNDTFIGQQVVLKAIVMLKEAWEPEVEEDPAEGAPRRVKKSDMDSASNYTIVPVSGSVSNDITTGTADLKVYGNVESVEYYNAAGMKSDKPFEGINIVVTRYTDGTVSTKKVVK